MKLRRQDTFLIIAAVTLILSVCFVLLRGLNWGIDLRGGAALQVSVVGGDEQAVETAIRDLNIPDLVVESFQERVVVKISASQSNVLESAANVRRILKEKFPDRATVLERADVVGAEVGLDLRMGGLFAVLLLSLSLFAYISARFGAQFAVAAIVAITHDLFVMLAVFSVTQREVSVFIVAALIAVLGYSNHSTLIVFDRLRENVKAFPSATFYQNARRATREMLSRTVLSVVVSLVLVVALWAYGSGIIRDMAFVLTLGMITGTYSSVFVAVPTVTAIEKVAS